LNDASIKELGDALDTRQAFTDLLEVLADSNTNAVLDFLFGIEKHNDSAFIDSVSWTHNTVIASLAVDKEMMKSNTTYRELTGPEQEMLQKHLWRIKVLDKGKLPEAGTFLLPFPALTEAAGQIAHINMDPDPDGIYRRTPLLYE
jgi:CHASE2 domain-containing sensor protein